MSENDNAPSNEGNADVKGQQSPEENKGEGNPSPSPMDEAKQLRDENKKLVEELRKENDRAERLRTNEILGGGSPATKENQKKEETDSEYTKRMEKEGKL